jgi:hypothetical protein
VDKYYRRTKEGRAGRQDGKSYRFFSELEALHAAAPQRQQQQAAAQADPQPSAAMPWGTAAPGALLAPPGAGLLGLSFSSLSGSDSESGDEFEFDDKGDGDASECDREMMALCDGMIGQVTEKLDEMQRVFLDTLEKWEVERTAREEAWRRQELARMNRECEQLAKERAAAASRDAALIAFLQRVGGGQSGLRLPPPPSSVSVPTPMPDRASPSPRQYAATTSLQVVPVPPKPEEAWAGGDGISGSTPSRWPKEEVQALIQLRTEKDEQYHDTGSKRPLWEDIAAGMRRIGYNRSAKRCKEKWENINKYFKKVKESNKRRPEDSKTCPYFHQLDAMYRKKRFAGRPGGSGTAAGTHVTVVTASSGQARPSQRELEGKTSNDFGIDKQTIIGVADVHLLPGNSETAPATTSVRMVGDSAKQKQAINQRTFNVKVSHSLKP